MGAAYLVNAKLKIKDPVKFVNDSKDCLLGEDCWDKEYENAIENLRTVEDVMAFLLAAKQNTARYVVQQDGYVMYTSAFDASYGWEGILDGWFNDIVDDLDDGSYLLVDGDEQAWENVVRNGKIKCRPDRSRIAYKDRTPFENFYLDEYDAGHGKKTPKVDIRKL